MSSDSYVIYQLDIKTDEHRISLYKHLCKIMSGIAYTGWALWAQPFSKVLFSTLLNDASVIQVSCTFYSVGVSDKSS